MKVVTATHAALTEFYGLDPAITCQAFMAVEDGKVYGVCGIHTIDTGIVLFAKLTDELRHYPKLILKQGRELVKVALKKNLPLYAKADCEIEASVRYLERLGFKRMYGEVFTWQQQQR